MDGPIVDKVGDTVHGISELVLIAIAGIFVGGSPNNDIGLVGRG